MHSRELRFTTALGLWCLGAVAAGTSGCNLTNGYWKNMTGTGYFEQGNYSLARQEFQRAVIDCPHNADYIHNLATAMKKQGDLASAEQTYRKVLFLDPSHQPSYHSLALLLMEQRRQADALDLMATWSDTQPYLAESHIETAWVQRELGDLAGAERNLLQALQVHPNHHVATAHLGQLYQDSGQPDRAVALYQRSLYTNWFQPDVQSRVAALGQSPTALMARPLAPSQPTFAQAGTTGMVHFGAPQRVALAHPLSTYGSLPAGNLATAPLVTVAPAPQIAVPQADADPAHAADTASETPEVAPF